MAEASKPRARNASSSGKAAVSAARQSSRKGNNTSRAGSAGLAESAGFSGLDPEWLADVQELSFQEARTALELAMAQLQSDALEVEEMAGLYRRAEAYAKRCEAVLQQVEQEVIQWDPEDAPATP